MLVSTLTLGAFDALPVHDRRCVFWTINPDAGDRPEDVGDPEFEKEAWLSMVMLEWGPCGQIAVENGFPRGCSVYAPPGAVSRATCFPTSPVSPDAVLLTSLRPMELVESDPGEQGTRVGGQDDVRTVLLAATVRDLINRGVRALEAFAVRPVEGTGPGQEACASASSVAGCSADACMVEASFLVDYGFTVIAEHSRFPRLRLELDRDHGWKEDVEAALDRLLDAAELTVVAADPRVPVGAR